MRKLNSAGLVLLFLCTTLTDAFAQGTAFTYQGRLNANGVPANGSYDLQFAVYDSAGGATVIAGPLAGPGVPVTNGLFTVTLDFGTSVFTGPARWLEIGVRTNGAATFVPLNPRQALTPAPYSIHAGTASTAFTASNVVSGSVVTSLNNLRDGVTLAAGSNVTITPSGNTLTVHVPTSGSSNWFGSGGNTYFTSGNVGIGTTDPAERLTIGGVPSYNSGLKLTGNSAAGTGLAIENTSAGGHKYSLLSGASGTGVGAGGFGIYDDTIGDYRLTISPAGNVGIGPAFPTRKLTVFSSLYGIEHTDGSVRLGSYLSAAGGYLGTVSSHNLHFFVNDGGASMTIDTAQNVGVGTMAPAAKLDVNGDVLVRQALAFEAGGSPGLYTGTGGAEQNRYLQVLNSAGFPSASGLKAGGLLVSDSFGYANPGKSDIIVKGRIGVGTASPSTDSRIHAVASGGDNGVKGESPGWVGINGAGLYGVAGTTTSSSGYGVFGRSHTGGADASYAGYFEGYVKATQGLLVGTFGDFGSRVVATEFIETSDRNAKRNFASVDTGSILQRLVSLPIQTWNFTNQSESVRHIGPMAQDFHAAFQVGQDDKHISTIDVGGVAFAAIQGLNQKLEDELKRRDAENAELKQRVTELEQLMKALTERFSGSAR